MALRSGQRTFTLDMNVSHFELTGQVEGESFCFSHGDAYGGNGYRIVA